MAKQVDHHFFAAWNAEMAYVFGFWFADGWITQPDKDLIVGFVTKDLAHLQLIRKSMNAEQSIYARRDGCFQLAIGSKSIWHDLYNLGGRPAKSLVAEMPFIPQGLVHHFVRGFVDGDGCLYWDTSQRPTPRINVFGGQVFLEQLAQMIDRETGVGITKVRVYTNKTPSLAYSGIKAQVLAKWMYTPGDLRLERKGFLAQEFGGWKLSNLGWKSRAVTTPRMLQILEV